MVCPSVYASQEPVKYYNCEFHTDSKYRDSTCHSLSTKYISHSVVQLYWLIEGVPSRRLGGVRGGSLCWESTGSIRITVDNE